MGTNYYIQESGTKCCPNCGFGSRHIGKSSYGWHFALRVYPEESINTLEDWMKFFYMTNSRIHDEYGETITPDRMVEIITLRRRDTFTLQLPPGYTSEEHYLRVQHAQWGYNNLLKAVGVGVVGHGDGPYDYIVGEFS